MNPDNTKRPADPALPENSSTPPAATGARSVFSYPLAWLVLAIALAGSAGGWHIARQRAELEARKHFDEETSRITTALTERMLVYEGVLHGAVGLFAASVSVERAEWRAYLDSVSIEKRFPGVDGVGFVACVPSEKLEEFLAKARADNTPDFRVKNPSTNAELFIIKYLEPEERHWALIGTDTSVDPERWAVAERARNTGTSAIGEQVAMNDEQSQQRGFLIMLPVYRHGVPTGTLAERRAGIEGWVYARFITAQLMQEVAGNKTSLLHLTVLDGSDPELAEVIFDDDPQWYDRNRAVRPRFADTISVGLGGRTWTLLFASTPDFEAGLRHGSPVLVALGGGLISLLLFGIVWSLSTTRARALAMASNMTGALRETNERLQEEVRFRQAAEQSIKNSEALYHSLVESLPVNILRKDLQGRVTFANQRFCNEIGRPLPEMLGKNEADLFPPDLAARHQQEDRRVTETGATIATVEERTAAAGGKRFVEAIKTPLFDGTGNSIGLLGIFWDVTDKRRAEAALEYERHLLSTLMNNLPDRLYFKDLQSRFVRVNKAMFARRGLTDLAKIIGKTDFDFFTEEHARQAYEDEQEVIRTGQPFTKEEKETWPDGSATWALSTKMPLHDENGQIMGTFGISRDITDRKHAEEAMRQARDAAEEANRTKSQFLASMSHELRTPLNSVIGFAGILLKNKDGKLSPAELNFLERIQANGKHLLGLINEILDLSKIEARKVELQISPVALDVLVRETIAQQEGLIRDRLIQLRADLPATIAPIQTDADKLKQVIINLIGNALKFTEQGTVTVRVATHPASHRPWRIDVIDTGIGIPQDKLGVIFEAFQQADATTARKYGGTGLGLTISQALCRLMGHHINVQSEVGQGSTFSVLLQPTPEVAAEVAVVAPDSPRGIRVLAPGALAEAGIPRGKPPVPAVPEAAAPGTTLRGKLVLVIDDELDSRTLLTHMIEEFGCQVIAASSGEQGLHMAREFRPHIITVDLLMPRMDGWQVLRAIKTDPHLNDIPVVVVSVVAGENRGRILGAVDVLQKPVSREELLAVIRRHLLPARPRILIVDDEADARRLLASYLEEEMAEIHTAANGREALALMETCAFDLVLLDLIMPVMDGLALLNVLRANPQHQHLAVVVVTAKELTAEESARLRQQAQEVLNKTDLVEEDFKRLLRRLLQNATPRLAPGNTRIRQGAGSHDGSSTGQAR